MTPEEHAAGRAVDAALVDVDTARQIIIRRAIVAVYNAVKAAERERIATEVEERSFKYGQRADRTGDMGARTAEGALDELLDFIRSSR